MQTNTMETDSALVGSDTGFADLLQQAEQLTADMNKSEELPRVERNLRQIMEVGEQLWVKTAQSGMATIDSSSDVRASILLGSKGIDLPRMSQKLESLSAVKSYEPLEPVRLTDIQGFLRNERENAILSVIEDSRNSTFKRAEKLHWQNLENEWEQEKQKILSALLVGDEHETLDITLDSEMPSILDSVNLRSSTSLNNIEVAYAKQIISYNEKNVQGGIKDNLCQKFQEISSKFDDKNVTDLWSMVSSMCDISLTVGKDTLAARTSSSMQTAFINQARIYLERKYVDLVKTTISGNLQKAHLGGVPGSYHLIKSYMNVKLPSNYPGLEDGLVDGQPVWPVIYFCIRCGDLNAALQAAISAGPVLEDFTLYLKEFMASKERRLSPNTETKIKLEYRRSIRNSSDPYKRLVYCVIGCCDLSDFHSEVADKTEDFLWLCLFLIRVESDVDIDSTLGIDNLQSKNVHTDKLTLPRLQTMLLEEYGESHFNAFQQPFLYFQVLFLTAQFEAAIGFLARIERLRCHSVHIAITLYQLDLLALPLSIQTGLLSKNDADAPPMRRLNFSRLIMMYARKFDATDPIEALNYFYFLKDLKGNNGDNLFMSCVSELVLETREFEMLLGTLQADGCRTPGAIDKFNIDTQKVIEVVATNCETKGQFEDAVKLYDLANKHDNVLALMNNLLSQVVHQPWSPQSKRDRLQAMAVNIAERFRSHGHNGSREKTATFYLLLDLCTFFDYFYEKNLQEALNIMKRIKLVPFQKDEVEERVDNFKRLADEVRRSFPDVLLTTMNILHSNYESAKSSQLEQKPVGFTTEEQRSDKIVDYLRQQARSLLMFAGMIPYRLPGDTNAALVQLEVLMN